MNARRICTVSALAFGLAACSPSPPDDPPASPSSGATAEASAGSPAPDMAADISRLQAEGPLPTARAASALEFWLHYKLMQATGMQEALGGEERAVATLKALSVAYERSSQAMQAAIPKMVPANFDGTGMDAGVQGVGYGLLGGAMVGGMLNGNLTQSQIEQAIKEGPVRFDGQDGSAELNIAQDGLDTTLEQNVHEGGVAGQVRTKIHLDACPDPEGKLVVTIETQSNMSAGGHSGSVKVQFTYHRWLDEDARLINDGSGSEEYIHVQMSGTGARGNPLSVDMTRISRRGSDTYTGDISETGHSFFRPEESRHTQALLEGTVKSMRLIAEVMLNGALTGGKAPWENGRCVELKLRTSPEKRTGAEPDTQYTVFAEPRAKADGLPAGGTVRATLNGPTRLSPDGKVRADAQFDYRNPGKKDEKATISFEARSRRGVARGTLDFDTRRQGYRIVASDAGACSEPITVCDASKPFTHTVCGGQVVWTHTPTSDRGGGFRFHY